MNKNRINGWIMKAADIIREVGIVENGVINKQWRGQISSFGAAVANGSLKAAIAFFAAQNGASVDRARLMEAVARLVLDENVNIQDPACRLLREVSTSTSQFELKEKIMDAAVAIKLAMNLYPFEEEKKN